MAASAQPVLLPQLSKPVQDASSSLGDKPPLPPLPRPAAKQRNDKVLTVWRILRAGRTGSEPYMAYTETCLRLQAKAAAEAEQDARKKRGRDGALTWEIAPALEVPAVSGTIDLSRNANTK